MNIPVNSGALEIINNAQHPNNYEGVPDWAMITIFIIHAITIVVGICLVIKAFRD